MMKKMFALASVTALTGLVATMSAVGCSSTISSVEPTEGGGGGLTEAGPKKEAGPPVVDPDGGDTDGSTGKVEEKTVGKECASTADCKVAGSVNDNVCSKGLFGKSAADADDLYGSPVCLQTKCDIGTAGTTADVICDDGPGVCIPASATQNICLPACTFDSTKIDGACAGGNKCNPAYTLTDPMTMKVSALGYCFGACGADADCKGTAGMKCQVEDGLCVKTPVVFAKAVGAGCTRPAMAADPAQCNCNFVGNHADGGVSPDADKGFCTHACVTGAAGDAVCGTAKATWKCTAKLPKLDSAGKPAFTAQVDNISGSCAQPCTMDSECSTLNTAVGGTGTLVKCKAYAGGSFCDATAD